MDAIANAEELSPKARHYSHDALMLNEGEDDSANS